MEDIQNYVSEKGFIDFEGLTKAHVEGLQPEQVAVISNLFKAAIDYRVANIYRGLDKEIADITGEAKPDGARTHEFVRTSLTKLKGQAEVATKEAADKIADLENQLQAARKGGSDAQVEQLQKDLQDAKDLAEGLKDQHQKAIGEWETKYSELNTKYGRAQISQDLVDFNYRDDIGENLRAMAISGAVDYVMGLTEEQDSEGRTVFRNNEDKLLLNPDNGLAPYTRKELLASRLGDVIDKGRQQTGTGTKTVTTKTTPDGVIMVSATTQKEAMAQLVAELQAQGIPQNDGRHQAAIDKAWEANNIGGLPVQ